jgi:hypothetical protein
MTDNIFITNCKIEKVYAISLKQINFHKLQSYYGKTKTLKENSYLLTDREI